MNVELQTQRLLLRDFTSRDFLTLHSIASDEAVTRYTSFGPNTEDQTSAFLHQAIEESCDENRDQFNLAIELLETGKLIGSTSISAAKSGSREVGYILDKECWGRGLGTELVAALARFVFTRLNTEELWAPVDDNNHASGKILAKNGFRLEKTIRNDRLKWSEGRDTRYYSLSLNEFNEWTDR